MLTEDQKRAILDSEIDTGLGFYSKELQEERNQAMEYYQGEAAGDLAPPSIDGRSEVVSTDVADVIEWILPTLLKVFTESENAVEFDATSEEDEPQAEQETDYVNHVFYKQNDGFIILYTWFKDALLQKVGTVKSVWDDKDVITTETYQRLTHDEYLDLVNDDEIEVEEHTENQTLEEGPQGPAPVITHDIKLKRTVTTGQGLVEAIPPEEFVVNADHRSINVSDARFTAHERIVTVSDLVAMGLEYDDVKDLPNIDDDNDEDDYRRDTVTDENEEAESHDVSQRRIRVYECYVMMDVEENGKAQMRYFLYVKNGKILEEDESDGNPFSCLTPIIMPHRHVGMSIFDRIKEVQRQKTAIWRNLLDNMYLQNNQRTAVQSGKVNLNDLLTSRAGGVVRVKSGTNPAEAVMPLITPPTGAAGYQMLEYMDKIRTERGGVSPESASPNFTLDNDTAHGIERIMSAKEELVGLIARVFGETGVKDMFLKLRAELSKNQDHEAVAKLRGKWVAVNPSEWRERTGMTAKVGLGTGDKIKQQQALGGVLATQEKLMTGGASGVLVNPKGVYKALIDLSKISGLDGTQYYMNPDDAPQQKQPPKPDPTIEMLKAQLEIEKERNQLTNQKNQMQHQKDQYQMSMLKQKQELESIRVKLDDEHHKDELDFKYDKLFQDMQAKLTEMELQWSTNVAGSIV